jgi:hypothetical protein
MAACQPGIGAASCGMLRSFLVSLFPVLLAISAGTAWADTLTYPDLVHRLTDLDHLAVAPAPGEKTALASSYDRSSTYDAATDTYHYWDANGDGGGIVRQEGTESVLMDVQGPGCIWRTWSATPDKGHVKIYLDGAETPVLDLPFSAYFDNSTAPFTRTHIAYHTPSNGFDNFTPIPFQKSCKIVADQGWGAYYHFNYTLFPSDTVVPTFKLPLSDADNAALDEADKILAAAGTKPNADLPGETTDKKDVPVEAGAKATVVDLPGSGAITALKVKFPMPTNPDDQKNLLRQLAVRITWDGESAPAVWAPLGDFFANALFPVKYSNLVTGLTDDGQYYMYWYMPFASGAHVEIENDSAAAITTSWEVSHAPLDAAKAAALLRFHAKWHRDAFLPTRHDREPDWTLLTTTGTGRYVGTQLHLWNPRGGWWGEGDEKFFVDGEKFPSYFGTGSEDYFGYAWGGPGRWVRAFHAQILNENNNGHVDDQRWLIADNVPFHNSFEGDIEKYMPNTLPDPANHPFDPISLFATVAYWYLSADGTDSYGEIPVDQRVGYWTSNASYREPGVIEAESMELAKWTQNNIRNEGMWGAWPGALKGTKEGAWSNNRQLAWDPLNLQDHLDLKLPVEKTGKYQVIVRPTKAPNYGIFQFGVDGQNMGAPIDLYNKDIVPGDPVTLGTVQLTAGDHVLNITPTGKNPAITGDSPVATLGFDYVKLVPVP